MGFDSQKNLEHIENMRNQGSVWDDYCRICYEPLYDEKCVCMECQEHLGIPDE